MSTTFPRSNLWEELLLILAVFMWNRVVSFYASFISSFSGILTKYEREREPQKGGFDEIESILWMGCMQFAREGKSEIEVSRNSGEFRKGTRMCAAKRVKRH